MTEGGDGTFGKVVSEETKEKIRQKAIGREVTIDASRISGCDRRGIQRQLQNPVDPNNKRAWNNAKYIWKYKEELTEQSN